MEFRQRRPLQTSNLVISDKSNISVKYKNSNLGIHVRCGDDKQGLFVSAVTNEAPSLVKERIPEGSQIISVNKHNLEHSSFDEGIKHFAQETPPITIHFRLPLPTDWMNCVCCIGNVCSIIGGGVSIIMALMCLFSWWWLPSGYYPSKCTMQESIIEECCYYRSCDYGAQYSYNFTTFSEHCQSMYFHGSKKKNKTKHFIHKGSCAASSQTIGNPKWSVNETIDCFPSFDCSEWRLDIQQIYDNIQWKGFWIVKILISIATVWIIICVYGCCRRRRPKMERITFTNAETITNTDEYVVGEYAV
eukprot:322055_1